MNFLLKFVIVYSLLIFFYLSFLNKYNSSENESDDFTRIVSNQVVYVIKFLGYKCESIPNETEASFKIFVNQKYVARVVEGCNAINIGIIFIAFIISFKGRFPAIFYFILGGILLIHLLNIIRISLLCIAILLYPQYEHLLHGVLFPLIIYGVIFLLGYIWVSKFSLLCSTT